VRRSPFLVVALGFFLFSLVGVPPLVGFAAKFQIFLVLFKAGNDYATSAPILSHMSYALVVIAGINTVISLVYYLRVLKVMALEKPVDDTEKSRPTSLSWSLFAGLMAAAVLVLGVLWGPLEKYGSDWGASPFKPPTKLSRAAAG